MYRSCNYFLVCLGMVTLIILGSCTKTTTPTNDTMYKGWAVGQAESGFGTIISSSNDGLNWVRQGSQSQASGVDLLDIHGIDVNNVWAVGGIYKGYGLILHSADGGISWNRQGTATEISNSKLYAVHALDLLNIWVAGDNKLLINSKDGGYTWSQVSLSSMPPTSFYSITSYGTKSLWVAGTTVDTASTSGSDTIGFVMHSTDGGTTWTRQLNGYSFPGSFLDASAGSDSIVYLSGATSVYKTLNGGNTWIKMLDAPGRNLNGICAVDVENIWTVGDADGIFHSTDGGMSWKNLIPSVRGFRYMGVTVADVNRIWIAGELTTGVGKGSILYSRNAGDTWFIEELPVETGLRRISFASARR
ncbi:MAG: YCF48-related protein [Bacteroidota bacterium]